MPRTPPRIADGERRARLLVRHRLHPTSRAATVADAAASVVALHASDPVSVFLSTRARAGLEPVAIERELYEARTVVRMLGMRRTLFVVPRGLRPAVQTGCTDAIARRERARLEQWLAGAPAVGDPAAWVRRARRAALAALDERGEAATAELVRAVPLLATKIVVGSGRWTLTQSAGSRVLALLAAEGLLLRARPRGTWVSSQYRWAPAAAWLGEEQPPVRAADARDELVRRWLAANGPGTERDLRWWTGLGARPIRESLARLGAVEVGLEGGGSGLVLPDDVETEVRDLEPTAAFLPGLDPTAMGWQERRWLFGEHEPVLFDRNGNAGPTVLWAGRVVGAWAQRADGELAVRLLEDLGREAGDAIAREAEELAGWLGDVRITPRFPNPLERELAGA